MLPQKTVKTVQQTNYFTRFATWSTHEFPQKHSKFSRIDQFCNKKITDSPSSKQNWYVLRTCWTSYVDAKLVNQTKHRIVWWFQSNWPVLQQNNHFTRFATRPTHGFPQKHSKFSLIDQFCKKKSLIHQVRNKIDMCCEFVELVILMQNWWIRPNFEWLGGFSGIDQFCNKMINSPGSQHDPLMNSLKNIRSSVELTSFSKKITNSPSSQQNWYVLRTCWTSYFDAKLVNQTKLRIVRWFQSNWSVSQQND
jgi:hypothetical protein